MRGPTPQGTLGGRHAAAVGAAMLFAGLAALAAARPTSIQGAPTGMAAPSGSPAWTSLFPALLENLQRCDQFETTVEVWDAQDLAGFQMEIAFDPSVLQFQSAVVAPWLADRWGGHFAPAPVITDGNVGYSAVADGDASASGSGALAIVSFVAVGAGTSALDLHDVVLVNTVPETEAVTSTDAVVEVLDEMGPGCFPTATFTPEPGTASPSPTPGTPTASPTTGDGTPGTATATSSATPTVTSSPTREPGVTPSATATTGPDEPTPTPSTATPTSVPQTPATPPDVTFTLWLPSARRT